MREEDKSGGEKMEKQLYVMMIKRGKAYNRVTRAVIARHAENLRDLDQAGKLNSAVP